MGMRYSHGPVRVASGTPASDFSAGTPLMLNASSQLSGIPALYAAAAGIVGVAQSDSNQSDNNLVAYWVAQRDTVYTIETLTASSFTAGENKDLVLAGGNWSLADSANTSIVLVDVEGGTADVSSESSEVRVTFDPAALLYRA